MVPDQDHLAPDALVHLFSDAQQRADRRRLCLGGEPDDVPDQPVGTGAGPGSRPHGRAAAFGHRPPRGVWPASVGKRSRRDCRSGSAHLGVRHVDHDGHPPVGRGTCPRLPVIRRLAGLDVGSRVESHVRRIALQPAIGRSAGPGVFRVAARATMPESASWRLWR